MSNQMLGQWCILLGVIIVYLWLLSLFFTWACWCIGVSLLCLSRDFGCFYKPRFVIGDTDWLLVVSIISWHRQAYRKPPQIIQWSSQSPIYTEARNWQGWSATLSHLHMSLFPQHYVMSCKAHHLNSHRCMVCVTYVASVNKIINLQCGEDCVYTVLSKGIGMVINFMRVVIIFSCPSNITKSI